MPAAPSLFTAEAKAETKPEESKETTTTETTETVPAKTENAPPAEEKKADAAMDINMFADEESDEDEKKVLRKKKKKTDDPDAEEPAKEVDAEATEAKAPADPAPPAPSTEAAPAEPSATPAEAKPATGEAMDTSLQLNPPNSTGGDVAEPEQNLSMKMEENFGAIHVPAGAHLHPAIDGLGNSPVDGGRRRLLCWNDSGSIKQTVPDESESWSSNFSYEIDFSSNRRFRHSENLSKAAIGNTGAVLACDTIMKVMQFEGNGRRLREWEAELEEGTTVRCVGISDDFVALCSDSAASSLRLYHLASGLLYESVDLPGPAVSCVGRGDSMAVFYNAYGGLFMSMFDLKAGTTKADGVPVNLGQVIQEMGGPNRRAKLKWCHISDVGSLYTMDETNTVRLLRKQFGAWRWQSFAELGDNLHAHSIDDDQAEQKIAYADINAAGLIPLAPLPMLQRTELKISLGVLRKGKETTLAEAEEQVLRRNAFYHARNALPTAKAEKKRVKTHNKQVNKSYIQMFMAACDLQDAEKCLTVAKSITIDKVLVAASQLAYTKGLHRISDQIKVMIQQREREAAAAAVPAPSPPSEPATLPAGGMSAKKPKTFSKRKTMDSASKPTAPMFGKKAAVEPVKEAPAPKKRRKNPFAKGKVAGTTAM